PAAGNNKLRHKTLQRFMFPNDSITVANEVPIWLTEDDIVSLERGTARSSCPLTVCNWRSLRESNSVGVRGQGKDAVAFASEPTLGNRSRRPEMSMNREKLQRDRAGADQLPRPQT